MFRTVTAVGVIVGLMLLTFSLVAEAGQDPIAKFEKSLDKLVRKCVKELEKADSAGEMDAIAARCEAGVFSLLAQLEEALGHSVDFTPFDVCVTNEALGYTACFDPIIIDGGS